MEPAINHKTDSNMLKCTMMFLVFLGLVAEGEKPQKQTGGLVVTKDLMGKTLYS